MLPQAVVSSWKTTPDKMRFALGTQIMRLSLTGVARLERGSPATATRGKHTHYNPPVPGGKACLTLLIGFSV